ncbi:homoserine kinase [Neisseria sp. Ec49-e6-T10]|uniref:homoserine kinase n=1 Tax=Neisseria sp. Ec49-e6-T10 TaxID=3140744 RepID=UPI003EBFC89E
MSVFTSVSEEDMRHFLQNYEIGDLIELKGIAQGVTNTNYFVTTTKNRYVLTVFEVLKADELPFYLELMKFLSKRGVVAPEPIEQRQGQLFGFLHDKPACLISCLSGSDVDIANNEQCFEVGAMLAKMHDVGQHFELNMANPRFSHWWNEQSEQLYALLPKQDAQLLKDTLYDLNNKPDTDLPSGAIHADLFKDNVLIDGNKVTGFIDFYYACNGSFIYDLAIAINDWARTDTHTIDQEKMNSMLSGYKSVRSLTLAEEQYLNTAQQAACIRFWVSRALDFYFPAEGEMTYVKNPDTFKNLLVWLRQQ